MKYLLDTNALLYTFSAPSELSARARRIVRSQKDLSVSFVSFWEIAIKQSIGKLKFNMTIPELEMQCHARNKHLGGGDRPRKTLDFSAFYGVCPQIRALNSCC